MFRVMDHSGSAVEVVSPVVVSIGRILYEGEKRNVREKFLEINERGCVILSRVPMLYFLAHSPCGGLSLTWQ